MFFQNFGVLSEHKAPKPPVFLKKPTNDKR